MQLCSFLAHYIQMFFIQIGQKKKTNSSTSLPNVNTSSSYSGSRQELNNSIITSASCSAPQNSSMYKSLSKARE